MEQLSVERYSNEDQTKLQSNCKFSCEHALSKNI